MGFNEVFAQAKKEEEERKKKQQQESEKKKLFETDIDKMKKRKKAMEEALG